MDSLNEEADVSDSVIALNIARRKQAAAEQACDHWDYESNGEWNHLCCYELTKAQENFVKAFKVWKASAQPSGEVK